MQEGGKLKHFRRKKGQGLKPRRYWKVQGSSRLIGGGRTHENRNSPEGGLRAPSRASGSKLTGLSQKGTRVWSMTAEVCLESE